MPGNETTEALAALLDQSIVAMAAAGTPGPGFDRWLVHDLADLWHEQVLSVFPVMLTRVRPLREERARLLLEWVASQEPTRRRLLYDLAAAAGVDLNPLVTWVDGDPLPRDFVPRPGHEDARRDYDAQVAADDPGALRLAFAESRALLVQDRIWEQFQLSPPSTPSIDPSTSLGPDPVWAPHKRLLETAPDWSRRQSEHALYDLTGASVRWLRIERGAGRWSATLNIDVPKYLSAGVVAYTPLHVWVDGLSDAVFDAADIDGLRLEPGVVRIGAGGVLRGADVVWTYHWYGLLAVREANPVPWSWPRGPAKAAAAELFRVLAQLRMVSRHRQLAGVPVPGLCATIAGAGRDLLHATGLPGRRERRAALTALATRWRGGPALDFNAPGSAGPPSAPILLAWHRGDHPGVPSGRGRGDAVHATAVHGSDLAGGGDNAVPRLRLRHRAGTLDYDLGHDLIDRW